MRLRVEARAATARAKVALHAAVVLDGAPDWEARLNVDDTVRVLGFQHALLRALDLAAGAARVAFAPDCRARNGPRCFVK